MSNNIKCPFCGRDLETELWDNIEYGRCNNQDCSYFWYGNLPIAVWQTIISSFNSLKIAENLYRQLALRYCDILDDISTTASQKTIDQEVEEYMQEYDKEIESATRSEVQDGNHEEH